MIFAVRPLLFFILRPIFYLGLRFMDWEPWERLRHNIAPQWFGPGSRHDFRSYFEGESIVPVKSIEAMCEWLGECEYVRDPELFHERDYWQRPNTFEQLRKGVPGVRFEMTTSRTLRSTLNSNHASRANRLTILLA